MTTPILIGQNLVLIDGSQTVTILSGGAAVPAIPHDTDEYRARAAALGYDDDTAAMSREHEITHSLLAAWMGLPESPTLRGVADGQDFPGWRDEEAAVLAIQRWARTMGADLVELARRIG